MSAKDQLKFKVGDFVDEQRLLSVVCFKAKDSFIQALKFNIYMSLLFCAGVLFHGYGSAAYNLKVVIAYLIVMPVPTFSLFAGFLIGDYLNKKIIVPRLRSAIVNSDFQIVEVEARHILDRIFASLWRRGKGYDQRKLMVHCTFKNNDAFQAYVIRLKGIFGAKVYYAIPCSYFPDNFETAVIKRAV